MTISLTDGDDTLTLPSDLEWSDQYGWSAPVASKTHTLTGAMIVQQGKRMAGRPITLESPDNERGWVKKNIVDSLMVLADKTDTDYQLLLNDGVTRRVRFDHTVTPISAKQLYFIDTPPDDHIYRITLKFVVVQ
jgi:hypothetical protein